MNIRNIVFDIGNVLVKWNPAKIIEDLAPDYPNKEILMEQIFKSQTWYDLNLGKISIHVAIKNYHTIIDLDSERINQLYDAIKKSLTPIDQSFSLLKKLYPQYDLYALTDNVHEIVSYLQSTYHFWDYFVGTVVSAEVGYLKPSREIYEYLLREYNLLPDETLFIDDMVQNVEGAKKTGIHSFQFINVEQCIQEFKKFNIFCN